MTNEKKKVKNWSGYVGIFIGVVGFVFLMIFCVFIALRLKTTKELTRLQEISGNSFIASVDGTVRRSI